MYTPHALLRPLPRALAPALLALALPWGLAPAAQPYRQSFDADPQGSVEIIAITDSIELSGWDQPRVEVSGSEEAGGRVRVNARHGRTVIEVRPGGGKQALSIHVPMKSTVSVTLVSGDIKVSGISGDANLRSVSGNISGQVGGNLRADTATGTIHMATPGAQWIEAKTIDGDIQLRGGGGEVDVQTVSGNAKVEVGTVSEARFKTISGNVTATLALAPDGHLEGESVSGDLRFDFAAVPAARFEVQTFSGSIDNCFGGKPEHTHYGPGTHLEFKSGEGSARVHIATKSGDVHLCAPGAHS